jgi:protein O-mannosyl-transferase
VARVFWAFAVLAAVALGINQRVFDAPLYYDSIGFLQENEHVFATEGLKGVIAIFPQRPVAMASFFGNYVLAGFSPFAFRVVNTMLVAATGLMVAMTLFLVLQCRSESHDRNERHVWCLSVSVGLVFVAHPVQGFLAAYVWQRMAILSGMFYVAAFALYLATRLGRAPAVLGYGGCFALFLCAMLSKENAVTLPAALVLGEIALFRPSRKEMAARVGAFAFAAVAVVGALSLLERAHGAGDNAVGIVSTLANYYEEGGITFSQVVATQCRNVFAYLSLIFVPSPSKIQMIAPGLIAGSFTDSWETLAAVVGVFALAVFGVVLLFRRPIVGLGVLLFLINLLPESLLVPQYLFIPYRASLPMIGLLLLVGDVASCGLLRIERAGGTALAAIVASVSFLVVLSLLGWASMTKAESWRNPVIFWQEAADRLPPIDGRIEKHGTVQVLNSYGLALQRAGRAAEAISVHEKALKVSPGVALTYVDLTNACIDAGDLDKARKTIERVLASAPESEDAHLALGRLLLKEGRLQESLAEFQEARRRAGKNPYAVGAAGFFLFQAHRYEEAIPFFRQALEMNPRSIGEQYSLGKSLMRLGRSEDARATLERTLELDPNHWEAHNDLGVLYAKSGNLDKAVTHFKTAARLNPGHPPIIANLNRALEALGAGKGRE